MAIVASRGNIIMMGGIAGAVVTNIYCTQPILPLIAADLGIGVAAVDLVAGAALLGFATGLGLLLPPGRRHRPTQAGAGADCARGRVGRIGSSCAWHMVADRSLLRARHRQLRTAATSQMRAFAVDLSAQGRINSLFMTATFAGGGLGVVASGWFVVHFGWTGVAAFGVVTGLTAAIIHCIRAPRPVDNLEKV
jgi:MFS family permease